MPSLHRPRPPSGQPKRKHTRRYGTSNKTLVKYTKPVANFRTTLTGKSGRGTIRPQNNVPLQSKIALRYKTSYMTSTIPSAGQGASPSASGAQLVINMSDPTASNIIGETNSSNLNPFTFFKSNSDQTGGLQNNLKQVITDSGMFEKYDHFYVARSVVTVKLRARPGQYKLAPWYENHGTQTPQEHWLEWQGPTLDGDLYNFAVISDRATDNLVDKTVWACREDLAGVKLRKSQVFAHSTGKDASFKLVYTPKRIGIKDAMDNRTLIGFTSAANVAENTYAHICFGKQMNPLGKGSANFVVDIAVDYEIIAMERRITNNDAEPKPLNRHAGDF